jgi:hypothetical protein
MHEGTTQGNLGKEITPNKENETWPNPNPLRLIAEVIVMNTKGSHLYFHLSLQSLN